MDEHANVAALMKLPGLDDMDYDPEGVYEKLTGAKKPDATSQDCMGVVLDTVTDKVRLLSNVKPKDKGPSYTYVETDFIRALKYGYVCEVQEPTVIMQPGVLVGLNSLLEQTGSITLPTGEVIRRHPDAVVVVTTNIAYEGCRGLNQSVTDRMSLAQDIELPSPEVMAQRAMSVTGCEDDVLVGQMVRVVNDMSDFMRKNGIVDGSCGMRSLIDWILSTEITGDPYTSALYTVISKATANEDDRYALMERFVTDYVRDNPASEGDETDNTTLAWLEYLRAAGVEQDYATGSIAEVLADVNDRLSGQTQQVTNSVSWSKDIFEMRLRQDSLRLQVGAQLDSLERSFNRIVVVAEHLPEISDKVLEELNRQATQLIWTMNASVDNAFADFDRQRGELQQYVTREREALVEQLRATGDELVRTTLGAVPGLVGKILLYLVLALAVLIGGPFALGFWLGGVRAKYRIKNEKLKMKN